MKPQALPYERIVFVCTNCRKPEERVCCAALGGEKIQKRLKERVKELKLRSRIRVSKSGCMDRCEQGPNVMIFPDNLWLSAVCEDDVDRIAAYLANESSTL